MKIAVALIVSLLTGLLAYSSLNVNIAHKSRFLKPAVENNCSINKSPSSLCKKIWFVFVIFISFVCTLFVFTKVNNVIGILRVLISFICVSGASCFDFAEKRIPNIFPLFMLLGGGFLLLLGIVLKNEFAILQAAESVIVALICFVMLLLAAFLSKGGIGAGDIKLLSALAVCGGSLIIIGTVFYSVLYCSICATYLLLSKKQSKKDGLPYAPFILLGYVTTIIFNNI